MKTRVTLDYLKDKKKKGEKIVALTAYDFVMAKMLDETGVDLILVGDSLGMVVLGYSDTLKVTMDEMIHHTCAVTRGVERALVVGDMPFLSYGASEELTIMNAARFIKEGGAQAVKLEGGRSMAAIVKKMTTLGIPVLGHIGMMPTHIMAQSGYHVQGKNESEKEVILEDALALEEAGVFGIVLECVNARLAQEITEKIHVPTIGIGAGSHCDGQILVSHDLLGLYEEMKPKFVKRYAQMADVMRKAFQAYREDVMKGKFPGKEQSY